MSARGQANLVALAVAVVLVTAAAGVGLALAASAADTDGAETLRERRLAEAAAAHLVAADSRLTARRQVVDVDRVAGLDASTLPSSVADADVAVAVELGEETVFSRGTVRSGATVRRLVLAGAGRTVTRRTNLSRPDVTVPRGVGTVDVTPAPAGNATVTTLRVDGRVVRHDPGGVEGRQRLRVDPATRTVVRAETPANATGELRVRYRRVVGTPTDLEVRVDA
jgi:hypothetical protein